MKHPKILTINFINFLIKHFKTIIFVHHPQKLTQIITKTNAPSNIFLKNHKKG